MGLPINIHDLINGMTVEWERLEFKAGLNPEDIMHTICAFANDINNWGGDTRPYKAPISLAEKSNLAFYVRDFSSTKKANESEERKLFELAEKVPFDDRINHQAVIEDMNLTMIKAFLKEINSDFFEQVNNIAFEELCQQMQIAKGPKEYIKPVNVGLLIFSEQPDKYFRGAKIEVVEYEDEVGDRFMEKIFTGPIHLQLRESLRYIKSNILKEQIIKVDGQPEALRVFNYPYGAVEESLANAVYHRSYEHQSSIEINIMPDRIEILSFPGPYPPVDNEQLKKPKIVSRDYRNRRIGDFLKELHLTEGRGTGIPKIRRAMLNNGSPTPVFETDLERSYFLTILPVNKAFIVSEKSGGINGGINLLQKIIETNPGKRTNELAVKINEPNRTVEKWIKKLKDDNLIEFRGSKKTGGYFSK